MMSTSNLSARRRVAWPATVVTVVGLAIAWLCYRYFVGTVVRTSEGIPVANLTSLEIGSFADPGFRPVVDTYAAVLPEYLKLPVEPVSETTDSALLAEKFETMLRSQLANKHWNVPGSVDIPPSAIAALGKHLSLLARRLSGMSFDEYLAALGTEAVIRPPSNTETLKFVAATYLPSEAVPTSESSQEAWRSLFSKVYALDERTDLHAARVSGWCNSADGFAAGIYELPSDGKFADPLFSRMTIEEKRFYAGSVSQGALVFTHCPDAERDLNGLTSLRAEIAMVVQASNGDRYPVLIQSFYDSKRDKWWLLYLNRQTSPRMANSPHLAF